jgi:hypothetical protein
MPTNTNETQVVNKYDRLYGGLHDVSLSTKPSTIKHVQALTGRSETFVIQTFRHEELGDYIFIEALDEGGLTRLALPPKVASAIAAQRESLTRRRRSISSRATMQRRMSEGWVPTFEKRRKR